MNEWPGTCIVYGDMMTAAYKHTPEMNFRGKPSMTLTAE